MALLPERSLSLAPSFVARRLAWALAPAGVLAALGAAALVLTVDDVARLRSQDEIAARGERARRVRVDIERDLSLSVFRARRYDVEFDDASGRAHSARVREHDVSITALVVEGPPEVRYDPADPTRISVGFARQNVRAQWTAVALLGAASVLFFALAGLLFAWISRPLRAARAAGRAGRLERSARVLSTQPSLDSAGRPTGEAHLLLALEELAVEELDSYRERGVRTSQRLGAGASARLEAVTHPGDPPCFLDRAGERVLVVTAGASEPTVVRRSGYPFSLDDRERRELAAQLPWAQPTTRSHVGSERAAPANG